MSRRTWSLALFLVCPSAVALAQASSESAEAIARVILDDSKPSAERDRLIKDNPGISSELITALSTGLTPGTKEEYRRIPWIWRVAIAAGKRNDPAEMLRILECSLPAAGTRLDDWRAVVLGGGIINGITQAGAWPGERIAEMLQGRPGLEARWNRAVDLAAVMADDMAVPTGTRYDALRMLGTQSWDRRGAQLFRYLIKGTHPELQMGAVSGLGDISSPCIAQILLSGVPHYNAANLNLALDALLRDKTRCEALLDAVADGRVPVSRLEKRRTDALIHHHEEAIRKRAAEVLERTSK